MKKLQMKNIIIIIIIIVLLGPNIFAKSIINVKGKVTLSDTHNTLNSNPIERYTKDCITLARNIGKNTYPVQTLPKPPSTRQSTIYRCTNNYGLLLYPVGFSTTPGNAIRIYKDPTGNANPVIIGNGPADSGKFPAFVGVKHEISMGGFVNSGSYYAESYNLATGATSATRTKVEIIDIDPPTITTSSPLTQYVCGSAITKLIKTSTTKGNIIRIYNQLTGGTLINSSEMQPVKEFLIHLIIVNKDKNFYAEAYNPKTKCVSNRITFRFKTFTINLPKNIPNLKNPDDDTDGIQTFDLTQNNRILLSDLQRKVPAAYCKVDFYTNAGLTNKISTPKTFNNTIPNDQNIYFKVFYDDGSYTTCSKVGSFKVIVTPKEVIETYCNNSSIPGYDVIIDLNTLKQKISSDTSPKYTFFADPNDRKNNINPITNVSAYNTRYLLRSFLPVGGDRIGKIVFARVEDKNGNYKTVDIRLIIHHNNSSFTLKSNYKKAITECDDDIDGIQTFDLTQNNNDLLQGKDLTNYNIDFYRDSGLTNKISAPTTFRNTTPYRQVIYFRISHKSSLTACDIDGSFNVIVPNIAINRGSFLKNYCDNDGVLDGETIIDLNTLKQKISSDTSLKYTFFKILSDAQNNTNPITNTATYDTRSSSIVSTFPHGKSYDLFVRVNKDGCHKITPITLFVNKSSFKLDSSYQKTITKCDDNTDGIQTFDLSSIKKEIEDKFTQRIDVTFYEKNTSGQYQNITDIKNYQNKTPHQQKLSISINALIGSGYCNYIGEHITLNVVRNSSNNTTFNIAATNDGILCNNKPVTLSITNLKNVKSYKWTNEKDVEIGRQKSIQVNKKGIYKATIETNTDCNIEKTINIQLAKPIPISIKNLNLYYENDNNILSINEGIGLYIFALDDDKDYKQIPEFRNITAGEHTLYVREKNNHCSLKTIVFNTIKIDKYFSPNGDGINDYWKIRGVDANFHKNSTIIIMDKNGNIFYHGALSKEGWDGKDGNGKYLPTGNYWYKISLTNGSKKIQEIIGNVALFR